ncbi:MAG: class A beta-lactamase [Muribaculaceae bacterium]|nr:class A beta-lactamase [Muribaculaceae bacterium]
MKKPGKDFLFAICCTLACLCAVTTLSACRSSVKPSAESYQQEIADSVSRIAEEYPGEIGIAVIIGNKDTVAVNDRNVYPMMSVFKLHQAISVCHRFDLDAMSLDSVMTVDRADLDPATWSPMLKQHPEPRISLPVKELLQYSLSLSDNNASNLMFDRLVGVAATDSLIATIIPRATFSIAYSEHDMAALHDRAYANSTSPLGAAMLINRLFTDSLLSPDKQEFITASLKDCRTGTDRIAAPLLDKAGVSIAHKTGSGYVNEKGQLVAHNDVAYITLPDGRSYSLAVFVKDLDGNERMASEAIARISAAVYSIVCNNSGI